MQVLSALARALRLSTAEREHLFVLAGQTAPGAGRIPVDLPPGVRRLMDQLDGVALTVCDAAWNMIEWNPLAAALIGDLSNSKTEHHPEVGMFVVDCDVLTAPGSDVKMVAYSAPVGSDAADRLKLLTVIGTQSLTRPDRCPQPPWLFPLTAPPGGRRISGCPTSRSSRCSPATR